MANLDGKCTTFASIDGALDMTKIKFSEIEVDGSNIPYYHRDISWLDFNLRVLQEAKDKHVPLFERIKFLAIYSNNLDEFFRVRVANNKNLLMVGRKTMRQLDFDPQKIQQSIIKIVNRQQRQFSDIFMKRIIPECAIHGIHFTFPEMITPEQEQFIDDYFDENMLPYVQPVLLDGKKIRPFLNNAALYLAIHLRDKEIQNDGSRYAIVKIPSDQLPRFVELPAQGNDRAIIFLDDLVRFRLQYFFPGFDIVESYSIKISRDAELYIDDEYSGDLIAKIKNSLAKRKVGPTSRMVYDREMPKEMLDYFVDVIDVSNLDIFEEGRYHNNFDFFQFPDFNKEHLKLKKLEPIPYPLIEDAEDIFKAIDEGDHLIHVPYHRYDSVILFFERAAEDPFVTHIKVVQYRVAQESRIMNALIAAAKSGKHVSVFVEVKARFDEELNLQWAEKLERHGIHVQYSFPGLKVHSKVALIQRRIEDKVSLYCYLSTGNFHEQTVKVYSDIGLFTSDKRLTLEVANVFSILETTHSHSTTFTHLLVGQYNLRQSLEDLIDFEIDRAKEGKQAEILLKMNSLQDPKMIAKLYDADRAGVRIRLIIRGICSLVPGLPHWSEGIEAISIVDRYLEHVRLFSFHHGGKELLYASSADWMVRNLSHRIETAFPILDKGIKSGLRRMLEIQWNDNVKSRWIHVTKNNEYRDIKHAISVQSQLELYHFYKRNEQYAELEN